MAKTVFIDLQRRPWRSRLLASGAGAITRGKGRQYLGAKRGGVYVGPGLEEGCIVVPASAVVALVSGIVVAVASGDAILGFGAGLGGLVAGVVAWLALWQLFAQLHPRFSNGAGNAVKYAVVIFGPLVVVCAAAVGIARS